MLLKTRRGLLMVADGMGDRPCSSLAGETPLQAARRPNLDRLASEGECGLMDVIAPGIRCGSDTGHLALLGYEPRDVYTGRGPFEALGIGMEVKPGDIALRCNFSTVDSDLTVLDRRAGRILSGTSLLAETVNGIVIEDVTCYFKESVAHRGALVLRGTGLSPKVSDADPHSEGVVILNSIGIDGSPEADKTARIINAFIRLSYERMKDHPVNSKRIEAGLPPANIILPRGAGMAPNIPNFNHQHGLLSACVVETGLIRGIGRFVGMNPVDAPGATGGFDSDPMFLAAAVLKAFEDHDFVLCNFKAPDLCGHDNNPALKREVIERFDTMIGYVVDRMKDDLILVVTADHSTPCELYDHSGDPVPMLLWGAGVRGDDVKEFHEKAVYKGMHNRIRGNALVSTMTQLMNMQEKFGA